MSENLGAEPRPNTPSPEGEQAPTPERSVAYPGLAILQKAVEQGWVRLESNEDSWFDTVTVDTEAIQPHVLELQSNSPQLEAPAEYKERFPEAELRQTIEQLYQQLPALLRQALPTVDWDRVAAQPTPTLHYEDKRTYGRYSDYRVIDAETNKVEIQAGGESLRFHIWRLQELAKQRGVELSDNDAQQAAALFVLSHEYGHHIERSYESPDELESPLYQNAKATQLLGEVQLFDTAASGVFSERFAQSIASGTLQEHLKDSPSVAQLARAQFTAAKADLIAEFTSLLRQGEAQGIDSLTWERFGYEIETALQARGYHDGAEVVRFPGWSTAGYYLEPYTKVELKILLSSTSDQPRQRAAA